MLAGPASNNHGARRQIQLGHTSDNGVRLTTDSITNPASEAHRLVNGSSPGTTLIATLWPSGQTKGSCSLPDQSVRVLFPLGVVFSLLPNLEVKRHRARPREPTRALGSARLEQPTYAQLLISAAPIVSFSELSDGPQALSDLTIAEWRVGTAFRSTVGHSTIVRRRLST